MIYGSVCSGIEAATAAWHPRGWRPAFFAEIDPFPRAVLAHRYPDVPVHGDFTTIQPGDYAAIDLLVGGTPCQSFSVAGLRGGLDDDRGKLALEFLRLARRLRPRWLVWENVPGVLSSNGGRDFGAILGGMVELGYGFAYRVLDAQYVRTQRFPRAVPQRRRRVFVVGHLGDWRAAAAVLFQRDSLSGHPAPRREAGNGTAPSLAGGTGGGSGHQYRQKGNEDAVVVAPAVARCVATREGSSQDFETTTMVAHALRAEGFDASEDGTVRGTPLVPVGVDLYNQAISGDVAVTVSTEGGGPCSGPSVMQPIAFHPTQDPISSEGVCHSLGTGSAQGCATAAVAFDAAQITSRANRTRVEPGLPVPTLMKESRMHVASPMMVRRLTPRECERLMGFPDHYTSIPRKVVHADPAGVGPCARRVVTATIVATNGTHYVGTNWCGSSQAECPRADLPTGVGYERCREICRQTGHAEINALRRAGSAAHGATLYVEGHSYVCGDCAKAASDAGVVEVRVGETPPGTCADGPRYKALGNSMEVNVMDWLGERIAAVDALMGSGPR